MSAGTPLSPGPCRSRSPGTWLSPCLVCRAIGRMARDVVVPTGNSEPEPWSQVTEGTVASSSTALGGKKPTAAPPALVAWTVTSAGTPERARSLSPTITRNVAVTVLGVSSVSDAPHVTVVVSRIGNVEPEAGVQAHRRPCFASCITAEGGGVADTVPSRRDVTPPVQVVLTPTASGVGRRPEYGRTNDSDVRRVGHR